MFERTMQKVRIENGRGVEIVDGLASDGAVIFDIPAHIPLPLVRTYPLGRGKVTTEHPHDVVSRIHREFPAAFFVPNLSALGGGWVFRRAEDIRRIWADPVNFSSRQIAPYAQFAGGTWQMVPAEQDPPKHRLYRKLLNPLFTAKAIAERTEQLREMARTYIAAFRDKGRCEIMEDFCLRFPIMVFLKLMNMPESRVEEFLHWEITMLRSGDIEKITQATKEVCNYLKQEINARRQYSGSDLISFALSAEIDGRKLNEDELIGLCFNLYLGGLDTVTAHMSQIFRFLGENPQHQAELRKHPEGIDAAIDELMRVHGSITLMRTCIHEQEISGVTIKPGDYVAVSSALASRDPEEYDNPDVVDFQRRPRLLSFGTGPHMCIGKHLAMLELRIAIEEFLASIPPFHVDQRTTIESDLGVVFIPSKVDIIW